MVAGILFAIGTYFLLAWFLPKMLDALVDILAELEETNAILRTRIKPPFPGGD